MLLNVLISFYYSCIDYPVKKTVAQLFFSFFKLKLILGQTLRPAGTDSGRLFITSKWYRHFDITKS